MDIREYLQAQGSELFSKRSAILTLWQTISENFYPERADFTASRNIGTEFAEHLMTSYPVLARRDLGNAFGTMLRNNAKNWFHMRTENWDTVGVEGRAWVEWVEKRMRRAMFHRTSMFKRATSQADHDFATFGQAVLQTTLNSTRSGLLYRCWHLRDVAWMEDQDGAASTVYRKWKPTNIMLKTLFGDMCSPEVLRLATDKPYEDVEVWHVILPTATCEYGEKVNTPFKSIYFDVTHNHIMEEVGVPEQEYTIPRWQTVSGSQYAYSPATVVALPDARLIQAMTAVLLEAGEKAVTPPMIATQEAIRSDINLYAGGITWADSSYDERLGEVLRPITMEKNGIPLGLEMTQDTRQMIAEAFYLNKLTLPAQVTDMTAFEVSQRVNEYIRQALPLFEPVEMEYNAPLCEVTFNRLMRAGAFGSPLDIPKELRGKQIEFAFESPLHDAVEREKGQRFLEVGQMLAHAVTLDPTIANVVDGNAAFRDVMKSIGVPAIWTRSEGAADVLTKQQQGQQQQIALLDQLQQGADVVQKIGSVQQPNVASTPI